MRLENSHNKHHDSCRFRGAAEYKLLRWVRGENYGKNQ